MSDSEWGLRCNITSRFGAGLVQEGDRLNYLPDRVVIIDEFSEEQIDSINHSRQQHCFTLFHNGLTCEAGTLGSHGYAYIAIYPTPH